MFGSGFSCSHRTYWFRLKGKRRRKQISSFFFFVCVTRVERLTRAIHGFFFFNIPRVSPVFWLRTRVRLVLFWNLFISTFYPFTFYSFLLSLSLSFVKYIHEGRRKKSAAPSGSLTAPFLRRRRRRRRSAPVAANTKKLRYQRG